MPSTGGGVAARMVTVLLAFVTVWYDQRTKSRGKEPGDYHRKIERTSADPIDSVPVVEGPPVGAAHRVESFCVTGARCHTQGASGRA
jgi:hypothetical protein